MYMYIYMNDNNKFIIIFFLLKINTCYIIIIYLLTHIHTH